MIKIFSLYFFALVFSIFQVHGQADSIDHKSKVNELVLLKNHEDLVPLKEIHKSNIVSISFLKTNHKTFQDRIDSYQISQHFQGNEIASIDFTTKALYLLATDTLTNHLNIFFDSIANSESKVIIVAEKSVISGKTNFVNQSESILYVPEIDSAYLDKAVQIMFGGKAISESLSDSIDTNFPKGFGLTNKAKTRLGYISPSDIGIDKDGLNNGISQIINEALDSAAFPGCQVLIAKDGNVFYHKSFGYHTYAKERLVINTDIYDLASITKTTAATLALMKLYDNSQINLDAKFAKYWPEFNRSNKKEITLREVLAHHARLKPWIPYYSVSQKKSGKYKRKTISSDSSEQFQYRLSSAYFMHNDFKEKKIYRWIRKSPLNKEPGYKYSGLSFYLFPEIIKNVSAIQFDTFLKQKFYKPLGANTLGFVAGNKFPKDRIVPTEEDDFFRKELLHGTVHDEGAALMKGISGNAGLFSNANDLAKVWQMLLNDGSYGGQQFLSKATIDEFTRCQYCDKENKRGLGFDKPLIEYDSIKSSVAKGSSANSYGHTGYTGTLVWADPDNDVLFIFLSNRVHPTRDNRKIYTLNIRPRIHNLVYELLNQSEIQD